MFLELQGLTCKKKGKLLGWVDVYYDFDWFEAFGHNMAKFPNGSYLGRLVRGRAESTGKMPLLYLTKKAEERKRVMQNDTHLCWVIPIDDYLAHAHADPSLAYLGRDLKDPSTVEMAKKLLEDPDRLNAVLTEVLTVQRIAEWVEEDPARRRELISALPSDGDTPIGDLDPDKVLDGLRLLNQLGDVGRIRAATEMLEILGDRDFGSGVLQDAIKLVDADIVSVIATVARRQEYRTGLDKLRRLIETNSTEPDLQACLEANQWVFGTEYSELLRRRVWVRDQQTDFMLRRTVDGHLEIIEIKRAITEDLFVLDGSHEGNFYPRSDLTKVLGQVMNYLEQIDAQHDAIAVRDREDVAKVRAKIVIGRDRSEDQLRALRRLNGHLHRIEVMTFDQLLRLGERTLSLLGTTGTADGQYGDERASTP